ncbi:uncharacterized protein LOC129894794 [Solanum dulcamara]|uniref:uncharacterized protein LOC129894794 n=1 Tax=Solanum dulcamara TaxID=45834 RepID=UPI0024861927|nr:uncharacterized protein LOC129894794 [Solanum dulcamara]
MVTKKRTITFEPIDNLYYCSAIATRSLVEKKEDPRVFTIPCTIDTFNFTRALCDLGASINLMPLAIYRQLGLGVPKPTTMRLLMAERLVMKPVRILYDVLVRVDRFVFSIDFFILDRVVDLEAPQSWKDHLWARAENW